VAINYLNKWVNIWSKQEFISDLGITTNWKSIFGKKLQAII
jgi:hypothetical protein